MSMSLRIRNIALESAVAVFWGVALSVAIPYARLQSLPIRAMMITLGYLACFGSLLLLRKWKNRGTLDGPALSWLALVSIAVLLIVIAYERVSTSQEHLWIALGALALAAVASKFRSRGARSAKFVWVAVIAIAVALYFLAK